MTNELVCFARGFARKNESPKRVLQEKKTGMFPYLLHAHKIWSYLDRTRSTHLPSRNILVDSCEHTMKNGHHIYSLKYDQKYLMAL